MKKNLLVIGFIIQSLSLLSQDSTSQNMTKIGKVSISVGTVLKKEIIEIHTTTSSKGLIPEFGKIKTQIINIEDAASGEKISGIVFENRKSAYLDVEEIQGFLKFIEMLQKVDTEKPKYYTEYIYRSKDLTAYALYALLTYGKNSDTTWHYFIETDSYSSESETKLELKSLQEIRNSIIENINKMYIKPENIIKT